MNEEKTVVQVEEVTQVEKQPAEVVTDEKVEEVFGKEFIEDMEKTAADLAAEAAQTAKVETVTQEAQPETIDPAALTAENIAAYLPALLMSLANDKHNTSIILAAGIEAGAINPIALLDYFQTGRMPAVHTFDVWKKAGYTVRKGEHAAFTARIWKYTEKTQEAETENDEEGEAITTHNFIKKVAYFFTAAQVDKTPEPAALPELPADVKMEVRKGCQWISGNTRPIKEALKAAGFRWSKNNSAWYRRAA